jgi:hypothetical protein
MTCVAEGEPGHVRAIESVMDCECSATAAAVIKNVWYGKLATGLRDLSNDVPTGRPGTACLFRAKRLKSLHDYDSQE